MLTNTGFPSPSAGIERNVELANTSLNTVGGNERGSAGGARLTLGGGSGRGGSSSSRGGAGPLAMVVTAGKQGSGDGGGLGGVGGGAAGGGGNAMGFPTLLSSGSGGGGGSSSAMGVLTSVDRGGRGTGSSNSGMDFLRPADRGGGGGAALGTLPVASSPVGGGFARTVQLLNLLHINIANADIAGLGLNPDSPHVALVNNVSRVNNALETMLCQDAAVHGFTAALQQLNTMAATLAPLQQCGLLYMTCLSSQGHHDPSYTMRQRLAPLLQSVNDVMQSLTPLLGLAADGLTHKLQRINSLSKVIAGVGPNIPALHAVLERERLVECSTQLTALATAVGDVQQAMSTLLRGSPAMGGGVLGLTLQRMNDLDTTLASLHPTATVMQQLMLAIQNVPDPCVSTMQQRLSQLIPCVEDVQESLGPLLV